MKKIILVLTMLCTACEVTPYWREGQQDTTPFVSDTPIPAASGWHDYLVTGTVTIRKAPDSASPAVGYLLQGAVVPADCSFDGWCAVSGGYVIEGCLGVGDRTCQSK